MSDSPQVGRRRRACVVRGGLWDSTPAGPRTVSTLRELGYEVTVLCWNVGGDLPAREQADGFDILRFQRPVPASSKKYFLYWPLWWIWLFRQYLRGHYDLIHAMNLDAFVPAVACKLFRRVKVVYDIRDAWGLCLTGQPFPVPQLFTLLDRMVAPFADGILLSQGCLDVCAEFFGRPAARRVPVIQVLNVPEHDCGPDYRPADGQPLKINFSGRLSLLRGAFLLADAVESRSDLCLDAFGKLSDPAIRRRYEAMTNVTFDGLVSHQESLKRMDQADLISLLYDPSLKVIYISSANKMFEAMMLGKPYLCTAGSYPARVAEQYGLGWGLPYGDRQALTELLDKLVTHPELRVEAGRRGRQAYEKHYRWEHQRANLVLLYRYLFGDESIKPRPFQGWKRFVGSASS
ncbi:MAG: hypothetical protein BIFFINMI_00841 [Phycisphaerae bacterium]|nr:hypothetical protein [Phycisphaerae bacterium]